MSKGVASASASPRYNSNFRRRGLLCKQYRRSHARVQGGRSRRIACHRPVSRASRIEKTKKKKETRATDRIRQRMRRRKDEDETLENKAEYDYARKVDSNARRVAARAGDLKIALARALCPPGRSTERGLHVLPELRNQARTYTKLAARQRQKRRHITGRCSGSCSAAHDPQSSKQRDVLGRTVAEKKKKKSLLLLQ